MNPLFSIGYMKVGTFDEKKFPSSRAVLVENYFSKCVPFHVFHDFSTFRVFGRSGPHKMVKYALFTICVDKSCPQRHPPFEFI